MKTIREINKAIRDAIVLVGAGIVVWLIGVRLDFYEQLSAIVQQHEPHEVDEIVFAVIVSGFLGMFYTFGRLNELRVEIGRRQKAEQDAHWVATHDPLTRTFNRLGLAAKAAQFAADPAASCAILSIDLDGFKRVNDLFGHHAGDEALVEVALRLRAMFPKDDIFRLGGDEFLLVTEDHDHWRIGADAERIVKRLSQTYRVAGSTVEMGASVGIALYPRDTPDFDAAMRCADLAMYEGKRQGKGRAVWYRSEMNAEAIKRSELEACLRMALKAGDIVPYFQPLVDLNTGDIRGFEALARWQFKDGTFIPPVEFIPLAEETGLIVELSEQILRKACNEAVTWPADLQLAVNISPLQLGDKALGLRIIQILDETGLPPSRLEIEVTESALVADFGIAETILAGLQNMGIHIALDDFGTGYSSLSQLSRFHFDTLKIDRSFVSGFEHDERQQNIVRAVLGLGQGLGIKTTAEGIETARQAEVLKSIGCDFGQGYFYGRPMTGVAAGELIAGSHRKRA